MGSVKDNSKTNNNEVRLAPSEERCQKANETCWKTKTYSIDCCCALCSHSKSCPGSDAGDGVPTRKFKK